MGKNNHDFKGKNNPNYKHGWGGTGKKESWYTSWQNMKSRCQNPSNPKYINYGARGISVCDEWQTAQGFKEWVDLSGWKQGLSIDRIDNNGNYEPLNCRWISVSENSRKKTTTKITIEQAKEIRVRLSNGENAHELAKEYNVVHGTIWFIENKITHTEPMMHSKKKKSIRNAR